MIAVELEQPLGLSYQLRALGRWYEAALDVRPAEEAPAYEADAQFGA